MTLVNIMVKEVYFLFIEPCFVSMQEGFYKPCMHVLCEMPFHDVTHLVGYAFP